MFRFSSSRIVIWYLNFGAVFWPTIYTTRKFDAHCNLIQFIRSKQGLSVASKFKKQKHISHDRKPIHCSVVILLSAGLSAGQNVVIAFAQTSIFRSVLRRMGHVESIKMKLTWKPGLVLQLKCSCLYMFRGHCSRFQFATGKQNV